MSALDEIPGMDQLKQQVGVAAAGGRKKKPAPWGDPHVGEQPAAQQQGQQQAENQQHQQQQAQAAQHQQQEQPNPYADHFSHYADMIGKTNDAWREEMNSRVAQSQAQQERQHEQQLAMIEAQGRQAEQASQNAQAQAGDRARIQKNNAIMSMMGYGPAIHADANGTTVSGPFEHFSRSLLG